jgi:hypothetical protein
MREIQGERRDLRENPLIEEFFEIFLAFENFAQKYQVKFIIFYVYFE